MTNLNVQFIATDDKVNLEKLEREFGRHAAFREAAGQRFHRVVRRGRELSLSSRKGG